MNKYKWFIGVFGSLAIVLGGIFFFLLVTDIKDQQQEADNREKAQKEFEEQVDSIEVEAVDADNLPTESFFQDMIHKMSHQKVESNEKWAGHLRITPDRIAEMQAVLLKIEGTSKEYENYDFYEKTLTSWGHGDFENAVEVHNTIWQWKGGNVGRATGLLNAEEEQEYIKRYFD
ncbi:DUF6241 domain-containing protein [Halobacillus litoralis]|uniref:DUF6241 domain-containing protein n=1 Tax=Halobacillus litoralis TaxID=45668 RepID=UPI00249341CE|nr:DUF6241 domain-containing protein [Halobacillus litoralis]